MPKWSPAGSATVFPQRKCSKRSWRRQDAQNLLLLPHLPSYDDGYIYFDIAAAWHFDYYILAKDIYRYARDDGGAAIAIV